MTNPMEEVMAAHEAALEATDPMANLCVFSTVDAAGSPSARVLVVRAMTSEGLEFSVSARSPKMRALEATGRYEVVLFWRSIGRQFRLSGEHRFLDDARRSYYWSKKAYDSKMLEHFYDEVQEQSSPLESRQVLDEGIAALRARFPEGQDVPIPESLRAVRLEPERVELWTLSEDRMHERWEAIRSPGTHEWKRQRITP